MSVAASALGVLTCAMVGCIGECLKLCLSEKSDSLGMF